MKRFLIFLINELSMRQHGVVLQQTETMSFVQFENLQQLLHQRGVQLNIFLHYRRGNDFVDNLVRVQHRVVRKTWHRLQLLHQFVDEVRNENGCFTFSVDDGKMLIENRPVTEDVFDNVAQLLILGIKIRFFGY